ncbi:MAG TPA: hypothetical protein DDW68_07725 [Verrucomicrobiales bacterium]|nr:hypothetical protein [Verrucomicrobiales bacterium]HBE97047.1 hypothetical protein [Verrucomicrobiales bacterium]
MTIKTLSRRLSLKIFALGSLFGLTRSSRFAQEKSESKLDRLSGFWLVIIDTKASNQFPGWPVTIHQSENRGENKLLEFN